MDNFISQYPSEIVPVFNQEEILKYDDYLEGLSELIRQVCVYYRPRPGRSVSARYYLYSEGDVNKYIPFVRFYMAEYGLRDMGSLIDRGHTNYAVTDKKGQPLLFSMLFHQATNTALFIQGCEYESNKQDGTKIVNNG